MVNQTNLIYTLFFFINICFSQKSIILDKNFSNIDIILLGEQTHGDGAVFDEKIKIIKYLHENYNYNIIVFESGLYDNFKAYQLYADGKEHINIYNQSVFSIWSDTKAFQELLDYVAQNPEMKILGFDSQESVIFENFYLKDLKKMMDNYSISITNELYSKIEKTFIFKDIEQYVDNPKGFEKLLSSFKDIEKSLKSIPNKNLKEKVIEQVFKSTCSDLKSTYNYRMGGGIVQNPRDKQMAKNFIFLKNQFPNEKFIAWGASYHFANNISDVSYTSVTENYIKSQFKQENKANYQSEVQNEIKQIKELKYAIPMGKILKGHYKNKLYSIAFTSFEGEYFNMEYDRNFKIVKPFQNSFEYKLGALKKEKTFVDLSKYSDTVFYTSVLGYVPLYANWKIIFDGIYYIPTMYPPNYSEYLISESSKIKTTLKKDILKGQIFDKKTEKALNYTDIYYKSNNISTVSDINGAFRIDKRDCNYIYFSNFGYQTDSIAVNKIDSFLKVYLKPVKNINNLSEIIITGKAKRLTAKEIIKKARKRIKSNYIQKPYNQLFTCKVQKYDRKGQLKYKEQSLVNTYNKKGICESNNVESNFYGEIKHLINFTNNFNNTKWSYGTGNLWSILNKSLILSKSNVLYRTDSYDLTKEDIINYDGKKVYKVSFVNNSPGVYSTGYGYPAPKSSQGYIYIDKKTFAVLRYKHYIVRNRYLPKRIKKSFEIIHEIEESYKEINGLYYINLLEVKTKISTYSKDILLGISYDMFSLISQDIETENVTKIDRPLLNLVRGYKYIKNDNYLDR